MNLVSVFINAAHDLGHKQALQLYSIGSAKHCSSLWQQENTSHLAAAT
jgi:hypothetical protein